MKITLIKTMLFTIAAALCCSYQVAANTEMLSSYQRAAEVQRYSYDRWLLNNNLYAHWIDDKDLFWFQKQTTAGHHYVMVDAATGKQSPLFDHQTLATALQQASGKRVKADALPLSNLKVSLQQQQLNFQYEATHWRFHLLDQQLVQEPEPISETMLLSPDRQKALFLKNHNLWLKDIASGEEKALTTDGERYYAYGVIPDAYLRATIKPEAIWSADSQRILTIQTDDRQVKPFPLIDYAPSSGEVRPSAYEARTALPGDEFVTQFRMLSIDVATATQTAAHYPGLAAIRMNDTPISGERVWWHKDGKLAYFVDVSRGEQLARVIEFNTDNGLTKVLFEERSDTYLELSPIVYAPATLQYLEDTEELIWYSERSGWAHLYLYDLKNGKLKRQLTRGEWQVRDLIDVDQKRREALIAIAGYEKQKNPYYRQLARVNLNTGRLTMLSSSDADHQVHHQKDFNLRNLTFSGIDISTISGVSPSKNYLIETRQRPDQLSQSLLLDRQGAIISTIVSGDAANIPVHWSWPEVATFTAADGKTDIRGLIFKPSDFDSSKRYPVIDHIYGGPQVANVPKSFGGSSYINSASLAELGFIVVVIDGRGTAERSKAFRDASYSQVQQASYLADHIAAIQQLAAQRSYIDLDRVGIYGFSAGGYMSASAMVHYPEFFKVAVSWSGNHDQRLFWHTWGERYQGLVSADNYQMQATRNHVDKLQGKLLLIHGLKDVGVHPAQVFQLTQALIDHNKDFDLLILPRHGHALPGYPMRRKWDYFVRHLAGKVPPENFLLKSSQDWRRVDDSDKP